MKFDFSHFHPLMHRPFTRECFGWYGGPTHHLRLWWEYQAIDQIRSRTLCQIGRHYWVEYVDRNDMPSDKLCSACGKEK